MPLPVLASVLWIRMPDFALLVMVTVVVLPSVTVK